MDGIHLSDTSDVLVSGLFVEPEILVQSESDVIPI